MDEEEESYTKCIARVAKEASKNAVERAFRNGNPVTVYHDGYIVKKYPNGETEVIRKLENAECSVKGGVIMSSHEPEIKYKDGYGDTVGKLNPVDRILEITGFKNDSDYIYHVKMNVPTKYDMVELSDLLNDVAFKCKFIITDMNVNIVGAPDDD